MYIYNALAIPLRPTHMHAIPQGQIECSSSALRDMQWPWIFRPFIQPFLYQIHLNTKKYLGASPLWPCTARVPYRSWNDVINFTVVFLLDCLWRFCNLGPSLHYLADTGSRVQHRGPFKNLKVRIYGSGQAQAGLVWEPQTTSEQGT